MTLKLTPDLLRACYDFLNETEPFLSWAMPDSDNIKFQVARDRKTYGWFKCLNGVPIIAISSGAVGHTSTLISTMAHEMVHLHEYNSGALKSGVQHSATFRAWATKVTEVHGFDPVNF